MADDVQLSGGQPIDPRSGEPIGPLELRNGIAVGFPFEGGAGFDASRIKFGGIEQEGRVIGAPALYSPTGTMVVTNGVPRIQMADAATTDVYAVWALEEWWLGSTLAVYVEYVNDHGSGGDVVWNAELKEIDIGTQGPATSGTVVVQTLEAVTAPSAGLTNTYTVSSVVKGNEWTPSPGPFASFYALRLTRIGTHGSDTLGGPIGIIEVSYVRGL